MANQNKLMSFSHVLYPYHLLIMGGFPAKIDQSLVFSLYFLEHVVQTSLNVVGEHYYRTIQINVIIHYWCMEINMLTLFFTIFGSSLCTGKVLKCIITAKGDEATANACMFCAELFSQEVKQGRRT